MKRDEFKKWLIDNNIYSSLKQVTDCISRSNRVERALSEHFGNGFDLDSEYKRDGGERVLKLLSLRGENAEMEKLSITSLPIGKNSMDSIKSAVSKYFLFRSNTTSKSK